MKNKLTQILVEQQELVTPARTIKYDLCGGYEFKSQESKSQLREKRVVGNVAR